MKHYVLPADIQDQETVRLCGDDSRYLTGALRLKVGDSFPGLSRDGIPLHLTIEEIARGELTLRVQRRGQAAPAELGILLFQCLPKGRKLDDIVRHAVQAGVSVVVPVLSKHAVPDKSPGQQRRQRLQAIAREACQQSGAVRLAGVEDAIPFDQIPARWQQFRAGSAEQGKPSAALFFHQDPLAEESLHEYLAEHPSVLACVIGPEGGLSGKEVEQLQEWGFLPVYLGPRVLRTESAALYALGAVQTIMMEKERWTIKTK